MDREQRLTQLDGLRGLAALAVVVHHFPPAHIPIDLGRIGVWLFFVLSGFLITGILLRARFEARTSSQGRLGILRAFYARRFLRIFPLYYAVLIGGAVFEPRVRRVFPWFFFYLSNLYNAWAGELNIPMNHFWSLAVEEHFYLTWPALVLFAPETWLLPILGLIVAAGPISRFLLLQATGNTVTASVFTTSCLDPLAMGGMLALLVSRGAPPISRRRLDGALLGGGLGLMVLCHGLAGTSAKPEWAASLMPLAWSLLFAWLVGRAAEGLRGPSRFILESRPLTYIGVISYGVYVYHPLIPRLSGLILRPFGIPWVAGIMRSNPLTFVFVLVASLLVASVSWFAFEKPINDLKRFFPYKHRPPLRATPRPAIAHRSDRIEDWDAGLSRGKSPEVA
jgi:peptidoglycan/LPS O-acetylase OafA/YrhL